MQLGFVLSLVLCAASGISSAQNTVKIGELNSYKVFPAFLEPYKKGMELALEEINAPGNSGMLPGLEPPRSFAANTVEVRHFL